MFFTEPLFDGLSLWDWDSGEFLLVEVLTDGDSDVEGKFTDAVKVWKDGTHVIVFVGNEFSEGFSGNFEDFTWGVAGLGGNKGETDSWEDPGVVGLGWDELLAVLAGVVWEWRAGSEDGLFVGPFVGLGSSAFSLGCWVGKGENEWLFNVLAHFLDDFLGDEAWNTRNTNDASALVLLDTFDDGGDWFHIVHEWLVEVEEVGTFVGNEAFSIEH